VGLKLRDCVARREVWVALAGPDGSWREHAIHQRCRWL